jgi:uncharacterized protein (TIGR02444 family)
MFIRREGMGFAVLNAGWRSQNAPVMRLSGSLPYALIKLRVWATKASDGTSTRVLPYELKATRSKSWSSDRRGWFLSAESDFWAFSLRFYGLPGVEASCLVLQDSADADVNLLLLAIWAGVMGRALLPHEAVFADAAAKAWRDDVIKPLRTARRALKNRQYPHDPSAAASLRGTIGRSELEAERLQQEMLARTVALLHDPRAPLALVANNLACYAACLLNPLDSTHVGVLTRAASAIIQESND